MQQFSSQLHIVASLILIFVMWGRGNAINRLDFNVVNVSFPAHVKQEVNTHSTTLLEAVPAFYKHPCFPIPMSFCGLKQIFVSCVCGYMLDHWLCMAAFLHCSLMILMLMLLVLSYVVFFLRVHMICQCSSHILEYIELLADRNAL